MIRPASPADAAGIAEIWNPIIRDTLVTFNAAEKSLPEIAAMVTDRQAAGHGFFVAEAAGGITGFATYAQFRGGIGYAHTMEHTVLLAGHARGRGLAATRAPEPAALVRTLGKRGLGGADGHRGHGCVLPDSCGSVERSVEVHLDAALAVAERRGLPGASIATGCWA